MQGGLCFGERNLRAVEVRRQDKRPGLSVFGSSDGKMEVLSRLF
jgi:hypothetical protein